MAKASSTLRSAGGAARAAGFGLLLLAAACGSEVHVDDPPGEGGSGGSGASGGSGQTGPGGAGGSGGAGAGGAGAGGSGGGVGDCEALGHAACVGAFPACAPVYDDACCPSCEPGGCADCIDIQFHHCAPFADACGPNTPSCGFALPEHCAGKLPACGQPGGSPSPCGQSPGCTLAECPVNVDCDPAQQCIPVTGGACTAFCESLPPECPPGLIAEADGGCWTGLCIEAEVCASP